MTPPGGVSVDPDSLPNVEAGQVVLDQRGARAACGEPADSIGRRVVTLAPTGLALIECYPDGAADDALELVGFDLVRQTTRWRLSIPANATYRVGTSAVYALHELRSSASGLVDAELAYSLVAHDLATGAPRWTAAIENWLAAEDRVARATAESQFRLTEGPSAEPGTDDVVVTLNATTSLAVADGAELWHAPRTYITQAEGSYVTAGIVEVFGRNDNAYATHRTGIDPRTDAVVWDIELPEPDSAVPSTSEVIGTEEWVYRDSGYVTYDLRTGLTVRSAQFPTGWRNASVSPAGVLAVVDGELQLSTLDATSVAVWSVPASDETEVLVTGTDHVLLSVPAGYAIVNLADGQLVSEVEPAPVPGDPILVDGMVSLGGGDRIVALEAPSSR